MKNILHRVKSFASNRKVQVASSVAAGLSVAGSAFAVGVDVTGGAVSWSTLGDNTIATTLPAITGMAEVLGFVIAIGLAIKFAKKLGR